MQGKKKIKKIKKSCYHSFPSFRECPTLDFKALPDPFEAYLTRRRPVSFLKSYTYTINIRPKH